MLFFEGKENLLQLLSIKCRLASFLGPISKVRLLPQRAKQANGKLPIESIPYTSVFSYSVTLLCMKTKYLIGKKVGKK